MSADEHGRHPGTEALADLSEGLLDAPRAAAVRAHVAGCAACATDLAALAEVRSLLAAAPDPGPMPAEVAARLDAALRAAAGQGVAAAGVGVGAPVAGAPGAGAVDADASLAAPTAIAGYARRRRPAWTTRVLQAAAAVVLVGAAGAAVVPVLAGGDDEATSVAGGAAQPEAAGESAGGDGGPAEQDTATGPGPAAAPGSPTVLASGADYGSATLPSAARALAVPAPERAADGAGPEALARPNTAGEPSGTRPTASVPPAAPGGTDRLADPAALRDCLAGLGVGRAARVTVDLARYGGEPAALVVAAPADDPAAGLQVWVVRPACDPASDVLVQRTVPR